MILRIRYKQSGGHTHCRVFAGSRDGALGSCGELVFRNEEFDMLQTAIKKCLPIKSTDETDHIVELVVEE